MGLPALATAQSCHTKAVRLHGVHAKICTRHRRAKGQICVGRGCKGLLFYTSCCLDGRALGRPYGQDAGSDELEQSSAAAPVLGSHQCAAAQLQGPTSDAQSTKYALGRHATRITPLRKGTDTLTGADNVSSVCRIRCYCYSLSWREHCHRHLSTDFA